MARGFTGVVCDFESGRIPPLEQVVQELGNQCFRRSWTLLVPEQYGHCSPHAQVCICSALSGGTLVQRLREAQERFGRDRVVLALQRVAEDFFLPSPTGSGTPLTQEELRERIQQQQPSIFFSHELCARYFTYMSRESGAHFVLYDDASRRSPTRRRSWGCAALPPAGSSVDGRRKSGYNRGTQFYF